MTNLWFVGVIILFVLAALTSSSRKAKVEAVASITKKSVQLLVIILLAASTLWCPLYQSIVDAVECLGYQSKIAFFMLPNLSLLPRYSLLSWIYSFYQLLVIVINGAMLLVALSIIDDEFRSSIRKFGQRLSLNLNRRAAIRIACILLFILSAIFYLLTLRVLLEGTYEGFEPFIYIAHLIRYSSVGIPYVIIPLIVVKPDLVKKLSLALETEVVEQNDFRIKCYHFLIVFVITSFLLVSYTVVEPRDPNIVMFDDKTYHGVWMYIKEGVDFYKAWEKSFFPDPIPHVHYSLAFVIWMVCKRVECVKFELFLLCSLAFISTFYAIRRITGSAFLGALSMFYVFSFFSIKIFWFMLEPWAAPPAILGIAFLSYGQYLLSSIMLTLSFFFKETMLPLLLVASVFYPFLRIYWEERLQLSKKFYSEYCFPLCLLLTAVFILMHSATYFSEQRAAYFFDMFAPHLFIHQISCFMFPIGLVNFLLAILGLVTALRSDAHRATVAFLLLAVVFTHFLFIVCTGGCSLSSARHAEAAPLIEFMTAPLGLRVFAEDDGG